MFARLIDKPQSQAAANPNSRLLLHHSSASRKIDSRFEQEAERVAGQVMGLPETAPPAQKARTLQPESPRSQPAASSESLEGLPAGQPLDRQTRSFFETRFGHDFGSVRVHTDGQAAESARQLGAMAYTFKSHVVFGNGQYSPASSAGQRLLAHELTHVIQQQGSSATPGLAPARGLRVEHRSPPAIQRYGHDRASCTDEDLTKRLWPGDSLARQLVDTAISELSASPPAPYVAGVLERYFMTPTPDIPTILSNFRKLQAQFTANNHFYVCKQDCAGSKEVKTLGMTKVSRVFGGSGPIVLCMNNLQSDLHPPDLTAQTIIHEFAHRYLNFSGDTYCVWQCQGLSPSDALKNPDSYAALANELAFKKTLAAMKAKRAAETPK